MWVCADRFAKSVDNRNNDYCTDSVDHISDISQKIKVTLRGYAKA